MLTTILVLLIVLWLLGMVSGYHARRIHSPAAGARDRGHVDPGDPGPQTYLTPVARREIVASGEGRKGGARGGALVLSGLIFRSSYEYATLA